MTSIPLQLPVASVVGRDGQTAAVKHARLLRFERAIAAANRKIAALEEAAKAAEPSNVVDIKQDEAA
jgi:hypothetical protein